MQRMLSSSPNKEFSAKLTLLAFHEGVLDSAQLRRCVRIWLAEPEIDLATLLSEEFDVGSDTIEQLTEQLAVLHPPHEHAGPHLAFEEDTDNSESLLHAPASVSGLLADPSGHQSAEGGERHGDDELAKRSRRGKGKSGERSSRVDYYDSVHERFTRDDRLIPYLIQTALAYRHKVALDLRRFWRSLKSLVANIRDWLKINWRNALVATVAIIVFIPACFFLSQFISPNATNRENTRGAVASKLADTAPETSTDTERSVEMPVNPEPNDSKAASAPPVTGADRAAAIDRALNQPTRPAEDAGDSSIDSAPAVDLLAPAVTSAPASPSSVADSNETESATLSDVEPKVETPREPPKVDKAEQLRLALQRGSELLKRRQFARASVILKNATLQLPDSKELAQMLIISQLASKAYDSAGRRLTAEGFADAEDPVWQMLFAVWLLEAPASSRSSVRGELLTLSSLRAQTDIIRRCVAWIDAREGKAKQAVAVLGSKPIFGERSFADALFYCAALSKYGRKPEARVQLQYAKDEFAEHERTLRAESTPESPSYYAAIMASPKVAATINSFAAKLR
ncbi:MAG: hypothetical protein Aurels2KO_32740 [Aureliella sp.]